MSFWVSNFPDLFEQLGIVHRNLPDLIEQFNQTLVGLIQVFENLHCCHCPALVPILWTYLWVCPFENEPVG